jgi:hypothetical protein
LKQLSIFIGIIIFFFITACQSTQQTVKTNFIKVVSNKSKEEGGNPEVQLHYCLPLKGQAKTECLNKLYPGEINLFIESNNGERILLAGRGDSTIKKEIDFKGSDIFILYLNTQNVKVPLSSNIEHKKSEKGNSLIMIMEVKNIDKQVTLKDKEGNIVLDYTIIKK